MFDIEEKVSVTPNSNDVFQEEFVGTIIGFKFNLLCVKDQDDNVWEVEKDQCKVWEED
jgi:hypothetical protein